MRLSIKLVIVLLVLIWCLGIFSEWLIPFNNKITIALPFLHKTYSLVCHQIKTKLITNGTYETMVCARCTGIYLGSLISSIVLIFFNFKKSLGIKLLLIFSAPMLLDVFLYTINVYSYSKLIAFSTGLFFGSVGFLYLYNGLRQLFVELNSGKT